MKQRNPDHKSIRSTIQEGLQILTPDHRKGLRSVILISLLYAGIEAASVAIIFPFLAVAVNPQIVSSDPLIGPLKDFVGIESIRGFQIFLGISALVLVIASNVMGVVSKWVQAMYIARVKGELSSGLFRKSLHRDYMDLIGDSSARVQNMVITQSLTFGDAVILPIVSLIRTSVTGLFILGLLLVTRPVATLGVGVFLVGSYAAIFIATRTQLGRRGRIQVDAAERRHRVATESLAGLKEVKVYGTEELHAAEFQEPTIEYARQTGIINLLSQVPFHALQMIAFGGLMIVFLVLLAGDETLASVIPVMGYFAFAGYRLMPILQEGFSSLTRMRAGSAIVDNIKEDASAPEVPLRRTPERLHVEDAIRIHGLSFRYQGSDHDALHDIDVVIPKGKTAAFVGSSGAGKTTLVDIITGLLPPTQGSVEVDGTSIDGDRGIAWRASLGYVPQDVVLQDASVSQNVAFGVSMDDIDVDQVWTAIRLAHLESVMEDLSHGIETPIGDRGLRLSGGQRQRIGIARALYRDPDVIIFDEATSNLDSRSEKAITQAIDDLAGQKTILVIAHRLTTVKRADQIYVMEHGRIVSNGTYDELLQSDPHFRALALVEEEEDAD